MLENRTAAAAETTVARAPSAEPSTRSRSRRTNDPFSGISKNTAGGRRIADLLRGFLKAMGDPADVVLQANALRAAELTVAAESARAKLLAGTGDADSCVRLEGAASRAVRALGLDREAAKPAVPTFAEIAALAQQEADESRAREIAEDDAAESLGEAEGISDSEPSDPVAAVTPLSTDDTA